MGGDESALKELEGSMVGIILRDGSRFESCRLVSASRSSGTLWISFDGLDAFIPKMDVADVHRAGLAPPTSTARRWPAAS